MDLMDRDDIWMIQRACGSSLAHETLFAAGIGDFRAARTLIATERSSRLSWAL